MRNILLTSAALMLGTSAQAWTPTQEQAHSGAVAAVMAAWNETAGTKTAGVDKAGLEWQAVKGGAEMASWSGEKMMTAAELTGSEAAKVAVAAADQSQKWSGQAGAKAATDGGMVWADSDIKSKETVGGVQMADAADMNMPKAPGAFTGTGGPYESATGYPPCSRTVTDRCIQLYERGVREQVSQWKQGVGAMGGPFEPVADDGSKSGAAPSTSGPMKAGSSSPTMSGNGSGNMNHGGSTGDHSGHDMSTGGTAAGAKGTATPTMAPNGVGGPEIRSGYPACSRTVTDSCIQLNERGVTGRGN
jgi:hypothetical protein